MSTKSFDFWCPIPKDRHEAKWEKACLASRPQLLLLLRQVSGEANSFQYLAQRLSVAIQRGNSASVMGTMNGDDEEFFLYDLVQMFISIKKIIIIYIFLIFKKTK